LLINLEKKEEIRDFKLHKIENLLKLRFSKMSYSETLVLLDSYNGARLKQR
jgi:hypothetical protein